MIIQTETIVSANVDDCFNLARSAEILQSSIPPIRYSTVDFELKRFLGLGHKFYIDHDFLGGKLSFTTKYNLTEYVPPYKFSEELISIFFKEFKHTHEFKQQGNQTLMTDIIEYEMALGPIGKLLERRYVEALIREYLYKRTQLIKQKTK